MLARKFPVTLIQFIDPTPEPIKISISEIPGSLLDIDPELNTNFEENFSFQEGVMLEKCQRLDKSYLQNYKNFGSLINTGRLVQKFLWKQADIN